jgi:hydrogenase maturation protease
MDVLCIVRMSGNVPHELCIIGIQPKSLELGLDMTPEIWDKKEALIERVVQKLREWNIPCALQSPQE